MHIAIIVIIVMYEAQYQWRKFKAVNTIQLTWNPWSGGREESFILSKRQMTSEVKSAETYEYF